ncbi:MULTISPECIES: glycosyltransferase [unclassified Paludibacterium]|uniref:glycosyltransferase n=1 Tax=unclassified Paludibacterium TaxID=2618429 RepID=UPI001C04D5CE|nr:glycosyltransferase [Paludibacterium sp. B53371]BEV72222.1 glycosyltransferase [Paludibacterium sp. THUN1379]
MISIVIPAYNYGKYLPAAIDSVLAQGIDDLEILICDDASTDNTPEVIAEYEAKYPCVHGYRNLVNLGAILNYNYAVGLAQGEYVMVVSADDALMPGALKTLKAALDAHPECGYAFGRYNVQQADNNIFKLQHPGWLTEPYAGTRDEFAPQLAHDCYIQIGSTLFRNEVLQLREAFFDVTLKAFPGERFFRATDWDMMLDLSLRNVRGVFTNEVISVFRQHAKQASSVDTYAASGMAIVEHMLLLDRYLVETNLPRLSGQLGNIFTLLYGKYLFYVEHANPPSQEMDQYIHERFEYFRQRFNTLIKMDPLTVVSPALRAVLNKSTRQSQIAVQDGPFFSVIVAAYKRPRMLQDAVASILAQTCQDFEVLVVNDGGDMMENTVEWAGRDPRITYVRQPNRGLSAARNTAIKLARGQFVCFLDDDDLMQPNHLQVLRDGLVANPECVVYTGAELVTESVDKGVRREVKRSRYFVHEDYDMVRLQVANYLPVNIYAFARAWFDQVGVFDETLTALEDWDLLIRLSRATQFIHLQQTTVEVRQREDAEDHMTGRESGRLKALFSKIYERYDDMGNALIRVGRAAVMAADHPARASAGSTEYLLWQDAHGLREVDVEILAERMLTKWHRKPLITLVMKVAQANLEALGGTIQSLQQQMYQTWRLIVVADFPAPDPIFNSTDLLGWLEVESLENDEQVVAGLNAIVTDLPGDWLALVPPGTELSPECLLRLGDYVQGKDHLAAVYTDHDQLLLPGSFSDPQFKPDFNLEYLLSWDYIGAACVFNQQAVMNVGGFAAFPGKESYELLLRMSQQYGESSIGHIAFPMFHLPQVEEGVLEWTAQRVAIEQHLARLGRPGQVLDGARPGIFKVEYPVEGQPLVSIVIPNRDKLEFLQPCLESLFAKTAYQHFEVLVVDNQSQDPDVLDYYERVVAEYPDRVRVVSYDAPFNFSAQCNLGAGAARGDYVLLLNNDIEIVQPEWLERLLMHAQHSEVGAVGAKLVYPETGMVQHGGIVLGNGQIMLAIGNHYGMDCKLDDPGYMNRNQCDMSLSGLTGACLLVRRDVYQEVGGFNEELSVLFNDIEFGLRISRAGYKLLWTPYAILVHHHGMSVNARLADPIEQGRFAERSKREHMYMFEHWMKELANDRAYNRNLTLRNTPLTIEHGIPYTWDPEFTERPRILAAAIAGGSGEYRVVQPLRALAVAGKAQVCCIRMEQNRNLMPKPLEIERMNPDVLVSQNGFNDMHLETSRFYREFFPEKLRIVTIDDLLTDLPEKSSLYKHIKANFRDARRRMRECLALVDRAIVSTEPLAEACRDLIGDVRLVPNRLNKEMWWNLRSKRSVGPKPRVGWVGAQQHQGDLEIIQEVVRATADEVDWVFMGMWPKELEDLIKVKRNWVAFKDYPGTMASLNLDLAIAPLEVNAFNESKSNLRLLEYGAMGWPVVCTDIYPYQTNQAPVKRVPNTVEAWTDAIRERVHDLDAAYREGDALREWVGRHYLLEDHLDEWVQAFTR